MITFSREKEISCALIFLKLIHFSLLLPPSISWPPDNHFNAFAYCQLWDNVFWPRPWPWVRIERRAVLSGITCFSFYFLKTPRLGSDAVLKLYQCVLLFSRRTREYKLTSLPNLLFLFSLGGSREDSPPHRPVPSDSLRHIYREGVRHCGAASAPSNACKSFHQQDAALPHTPKPSLCFQSKDPTDAIKGYIYLWDPKR